MEDLLGSQVNGRCILEDLRFFLEIAVASWIGFSLWRALLLGVRCLLGDQGVSSLWGPRVVMRV